MTVEPYFAQHREEALMEGEETLIDFLKQKGFIVIDKCGIDGVLWGVGDSIISPIHEKANEQLRNAWIYCEKSRPSHGSSFFMVYGNNM